MYILGLHTSHDTSACLLKDGEIIVAIEKERLSRHKHQWGNNDLQSVVDYCLNYANITIENIEYIVVNEINNIFKEKVYSDKEYFISHHLAHAWAAVGLSPYKETAVMIIDGEGSKVIELFDDERQACNYDIDFFAEKESCYIYKDNILHPLKKWTSGRGGDSKFSGTDATGSPYWILSQHFFHKEHQESKIMGLSSYGTTDDRFENIFNLEAEGTVNIDKQWIFELRDVVENDLENNTNEYANIAATVQKGTEEAILHKAKWIKEVSQINNLCFSGGVALNCVANSKLAKSNIFENVFVPFGAGDSSISIGCAYYGWHVLAKGEKRNINKKLVSPYLGIDYSDAHIENCIQKYLSLKLIHVEKKADFIETAAKELNAGKILAWFQGKSEFGPRALGNRSILANPTIKGIRDILNEKVKFREKFRPFAPAIIEEFMDVWFENIVDNTYFMQFIANVKQRKIEIIPEVTHIDNSARIQVISKESNKTFYDLIYSFYNKSNVPILLNTSFNIQEPIVESPDDALLTFITSSIDSLYIDDYHIQSLVKVVKTKNQIQDKSYLIMVCHKEIQLRYSYSDNYSIQILSGMENNFKFGNYYQISNFKELIISEKLYNFLVKHKLQRGKIIKLLGEDIDTINQIYDELEKIILETRIASFIEYNNTI